MTTLTSTAPGTQLAQPTASLGYDVYAVEVDETTREPEVSHVGHRLELADAMQIAEEAWQGDWLVVLDAAEKPVKTYDRWRGWR